MKNIVDVTISFKKYLETQKDYFDYLRNRPRFFLGTHYIDKRFVIVKRSVKEAEKEDEDSGFLGRRRRRKKDPKDPVKQPVKQRERQREIDEPVGQPIKIPTTPAIKPPILSLPKVRVPAKPEETPLETPEEAPVPKPEVPVEPPAVPAPIEVPTPAEPAPAEPITLDLDETAVPMDPVVKPVFNLDQLLRKAPGTHTPAESQFLIDQGYDDFVKGGMATTDPVGDIVTLAAAAAIVFGLPALLGGGAATAPAAGTATATSKIVTTGGALGKVPAANNIIQFARQAAPMAKFAYGATGYGPTFSLAGERVPEAAVPSSKMGEFFRALLREAGSIATGIAAAASKRLNSGSAISSTIARLTSIFGAAKGFEVPVSIPSNIPTRDPDDTRPTDGGVLGNMIAFGKNMGAGLLSMAMASASILVSPAQAQPQSPVIVPDYDPSLQGAQIEAKGITNSGQVSGYPITSPYGWRWGRIHGGLDIGTPEGTAVGFNKPGEIVFAGPKGGYGYMIDAWIPSLNIQFRLAHLSQFIKKDGTFAAGEAIAKTGGAKGHPGAGSSTGEHLHLEVDTTKNGTVYGGANDPQLLGDMSKHVMLGSMNLGPRPGDPDFIGPVLPGQGGDGPKITSITDIQRTSQVETLRREKAEKLQTSRVNSIVQIPVQGPPSYSPQLTTIMRQRSSKRPYIISPFSKGVEQ